MNIKSIINIPHPAELQKVEAPKQEVKTGESADRDADGKREQEEHERRALTDDELQELEDQIRELPGVKEHGLQVRIEASNGSRVMLIEEPGGHVIRRIPESDFLPLLKRQRSQTGKILNKAV